MMRYGFRIGGKRLRPALVLLSGASVGEITPEHIAYGVVVELVHTATLIHDDVLDEADIRRHLDTANARWGNEASILLGDLLFAKAVELATMTDAPRALPLLGGATRRMVEGELCQVSKRGDLDLTEESYFDIIEGKTAALIDCSCGLGAVLGGAENVTLAALSQFGRYLGLAFQITDDMLDLMGDQAEIGKSLGSDLIKQKMTLPVIRLLAVAQPSDRREVIALLSRPDQEGSRGRLIKWLDRYDALAHTRAKAQELVTMAANCLDALPDSPARQSLLGVTEFVLSRRR